MRSFFKTTGKIREVAVFDSSKHLFESSKHLFESSKHLFKSSKHLFESSRHLSGHLKCFILFIINYPLLIIHCIFVVKLRIGVPILAEIKSFEPDTGNADAGNSKKLSQQFSIVLFIRFYYLFNLNRLKNEKNYFFINYAINDSHESPNI
jgi:hypothetical protein